jgi:hypothetical protein
MENAVSNPPTPAPTKKVKPWPEAHATNGAWESNSNTGRAQTCIQFLLFHGFLNDHQADALRAQVAERSASTD